MFARARLPWHQKSYRDWGELAHRAQIHEEYVERDGLYELVMSRWIDLGIWTSKTRVSLVLNRSK